MTTQELDDLCRDFLKKKAYQKRADDRMKEIKLETKEAQSKVIAALESLSKTENEGAFGKVKITQKEYYKVIDKEEAYAWLRERGEFDDMASINANTLSSHVKGLVKEAMNEGNFEWSPPGMMDATSDYAYLKVTEP